EDLHARRTPRRDARGEILRDDDDAPQLAGDEQRLELASMPGEPRVEVASRAERRRELARRPAVALDGDADGDAANVERNRESKQEQEHDRQHERDDDVRRIADDLKAL